MTSTDTEERGQEPQLLPQRSRLEVSELMPFDSGTLRSARALGFWAAVATAITYVTFDVGLLLDPVIPTPWDVWIAIGASALIAPSFILLVISIHYTTPETARVWTHSALAFALIYAALAEMVYATWLFVVEPHVVEGTEDKVALLVFEKGSFLQMVDGAAYTYMGFAALLTAVTFRGHKVRWIRWLAIANGPAAVSAFVSYLTYNFAFGVAAGVLMPAYAITLAKHFRSDHEGVNAS